MIGLPFVAGIVGMSFLLSRFTQTRYDHAEAKVKTLDAEEALALRADRRKVDIREEYYVRRCTRVQKLIGVATSGQPAADARLGAEAHRSTTGSSRMGHSAVSKSPG